MPEPMTIDLDETHGPAPAQLGRERERSLDRFHDPERLIMDRMEANMPLVHAVKDAGGGMRASSQGAAMASASLSSFAQNDPRIPFRPIERRAEHCGTESAEFANALIHSRQNVSPRRLDEPGPSAHQIEEILGAAAAAPDRGLLMPWRFVVVPMHQRWRLADVFGLALVDRDPNATSAQIENAREKAHRAPFLLVAVARLTERGELGGAAPAQGAHDHASGEAEVGDAERLVSFGCAIQNIVLSAHAAGFGTGITSGQALASPRLRTLLGLSESEQAVCCINIGTVTRHKAKRLRPVVSDYVSELK